jgi:hypothetical protein
MKSAPPVAVSVREGAIPTETADKGSGRIRSPDAKTGNREHSDQNREHSDQNREHSDRNREQSDTNREHSDKNRQRLD